jgi:hypothetical protein
MTGFVRQGQAHIDAGPRGHPFFYSHTRIRSKQSNQHVPRNRLERLVATAAQFGIMYSFQRSRPDWSDMNKPLQVRPKGAI